jgi:Uma2 family endonuclease
MVQNLSKTRHRLLASVKILLYSNMTTLTKWTVEDYHQMIDAGILSDRKVELINGDIINMSPEGTIHRFINHRGAKYLRSVLGNSAEVMEAHPITLDNSEPEPDLAIVRFPDTLYLDRHPYPKDIYWIIEIADSTLNRDLGMKKTLYASALIQEYWVIDVTQKSLKIWRNPLNNDYQSYQEINQGIIAPVAFPHIAISVERLIGLD